MKKTVIVKNSSTKIDVLSQHLVVKTASQEDVIGYRYIKELYINKLIDISMVNCLKLATKFDIYFINQHGKILGKVLSYEKV
ncbi:MAG: hypothetical protein U9N33_09250 [Campylobacterota bacterium]|nr:hypothetical protein [Campylobacterota bacterium]